MSLIKLLVWKTGGWFITVKINDKLLVGLVVSGYKMMIFSELFCVAAMATIKGAR